MIDVVCAQQPRSGTRVHAGVSIRAGGAALNAAVAAAEAGASSVLVGRIGSDPAAEAVLAALASARVHAQLARDPNEVTGAAVAFGAGDPAVVASRGANARLAVDDIPDPLEGDALFVSGFALFQEGSSEAATTALRRFHGSWAGIDAASPALAAVALGHDLRVGGHTRAVLFATADEARAMTGAGPDDAARALAARFSVSCIKLGADGVIAAAGDSVERVRVDPVRTTSPFGAGDAFAAVFLVELSRGQPLQQALSHACEAGARAAGARDDPS